MPIWTLQGSTPSHLHPIPQDELLKLEEVNVIIEFHLVLNDYLLQAINTKSGRGNGNISMYQRKRHSHKNEIYFCSSIDNLSSDS